MVELSGGAFSIFLIQKQRPSAQVFRFIDLQDIVWECFQCQRKKPVGIPSFFGIQRETVCILYVTAALVEGWVFFGDPIDPLLERFGGGCLLHPALSVLVIATAHLSMDVRHTRLPIAILVKVWHDKLQGLLLRLAEPNFRPFWLHDGAK